MAQGSCEENFPRSLKRSYSGNGNPEVAAEDAGCRLGEGGGGGGNEDASEESLSKIQKEVTELAEKVAEYREKGPAAFANLLEKSLAQMRSPVGLVDAQVNDKPANTVAEIQDDGASLDKEKLAQRTKLLERLASAKESLPTLLRDLKGCQERLDKAMIARRQRQAADSPLHPALDRDVKELLPDWEK